MEKLQLNDIYIFRYKEDFLYQGRFCGQIKIDGEIFFTFQVINQFRRNKEISKIIFEINKRFVSNKMFFQGNFIHNIRPENYYNVQKSLLESGEFIIRTDDKYSKSITVPADDLPNKILAAR